MNHTRFGRFTARRRPHDGPQLIDSEAFDRYDEVALGDRSTGFDPTLRTPLTPQNGVVEVAHVQKRNRGGKTTWRARVSLPNGQERSKSFARKADAELWLVEVQSKLAHGGFTDPHAGRITLADYAEVWRAAQLHRTSTSMVTTSRLNRHVLPTFGRRQLGSILPSEVQAWVKHLSTSLAPSTVEACYRLLATILRSAVDDRLIPNSPCIRIKLPSRHKPKVDPLTVEQVKAVRDQMPDRLKAIVTLAAGTGLRRGEALGLSIDRVDFPRRTLTIDRQMVKATGHHELFDVPKTRASIRTIPVPDVVLEELSAHIAIHPRDPEHELIFTNQHARPWSFARFAEVWRTAADNAGLPDGSRFHDLRHHTASLLIAAGCSVKVVQNQLGHASATETLDTYGHLWPTDDDHVRQAVNDAFTEVGDRRPSQRPGRQDSEPTTPPTPD